MKQKYVALKMYLVGLTVGLFILGWSAVAHQEVAQATAASPAVASQTSAGTTVQTLSTSDQTPSSSVQTVTTQPRIRTRTS